MDFYQALSRYCAYQERCLQEIEEKLRSMKAPNAEWPVILDRLKSDDFWNEERFARSFARGKFRILSWGRIRIRQELRMRGISAEMIHEALKEIDESEYYEVIRKLFQKKKKEWCKETVSVAQSKVYRYLTQKGFEAPLVLEIIGKYWSDTE